MLNEAIKTVEPRPRALLHRLFWWAYAERDETATERDRRLQLAAKDAEIAALKDHIAALKRDKGELRTRMEEAESRHIDDLKRSQTALEMTKLEVQILTEMHERLYKRVQSETVAYAARIPDEEKKPE